MNINNLNFKFNDEAGLTVRENLVVLTKKYLPLTKAEIDFGTKFEYTDKFINFIIEKAFQKAEKIEEVIPSIHDMIGDRKHNLIVDCSKAADIMLEGRLAEFPLVLDFDPKRGTLLKYNNRTLSKQLESEVVANNINNIKNNTEKDPTVKNTKNII